MMDDILSKIAKVRSIVGNDISDEKIKFYLHGADNDIEIAINHILNEREKDKTQSTTVNEKERSMEEILQDLAEEVKCPMCLSYFNNPVNLPCFHTFCSACVENIIRKNEVKCPLCRTTSDLGEIGIKSLKINHYLANIVDKLKSAQSTKMCVECAVTISTIYCKECKFSFCSECDEKTHASGKKIGHDRISFEECFADYKNGPSYKNLLFCSNNFRKNLKLYNSESRIESDYVIPFNVKKEVCVDLFHSWIKDLWFAPFDLQKSLVLHEFKAVLVPYWEFEVETFTKYNGTVGASPMQQNWFISGSKWEVGVYYNKFNHIMVCAAGSREANLVAHIEPWKTNQIEPFTLHHAEGVEIQPFTLEPDRAWANVGKLTVENLIEEGIKKQIRYNVSNLTMDTSYSNRKGKRVFVPVYITTYEYRGKSYYFLLNGNTAKAYGQRPFSAGKLASLSLTGISAIGFLTKV